MQLMTIFSVTVKLSNDSFFISNIFAELYSGIHSLWMCTQYINATMLGIKTNVIVKFMNQNSEAEKKKRGTNGNNRKTCEKGSGIS